MRKFAAGRTGTAAPTTLEEEDQDHARRKPPFVEQRGCPVLGRDIAVSSAVAVLEYRISLGFCVVELSGPSHAPCKEEQQREADVDEAERWSEEVVVVSGDEL